MGLQSWNKLAQDARAVLDRPVMANVAQHVHVRPGSGLRLEEVVWHKLYPCGELGRKSSFALLDCMLVVLNDQFFEIRVPPCQGNAEEAGGATDLNQGFSVSSSNEDDSQLLLEWVITPWV
jgi:hypothetical protein